MREDGRLGPLARGLIRKGIREKLQPPTQQELARRLRVHEDTISHWLTGSGGGPPSIKQLQELCKLFDLTPNDLLLEPEELEVSRRVEVRQAARLVLDRLFDEEANGPGPSPGPANGGMPHQ